MMKIQVPSKILQNHHKYGVNRALSCYTHHISHVPIKKCAIIPGKIMEHLHKSSKISRKKTKIWGQTEPRHTAKGTSCSILRMMAVAARYPPTVRKGRSESSSRWWPQHFTVKDRMASIRRGSGVTFAVS